MKKRIMQAIEDMKIEATIIGWKRLSQARDMDVMLLVFEHDVARMYEDWHRRTHNWLKATSQDYKDFLRSMDYVILRDKMSFLKAVKPEDLEQNGFEYLTTVSFKQPKRKGVRFGFLEFYAPDEMYQDLEIYRNSVKDSSIHPVW